MYMLLNCKLLYANFFKIRCNLLLNSVVIAYKYTNMVVELKTFINF